MSRNLMSTSCHECPAGPPALVEAPRPFSVEDSGYDYFVEYRGLIVANAQCEHCGSKYLAWVDWPGRGGRWGNPVGADGHRAEPYVDLSYRRSFNDEPSVSDLPLFEVERVVTYVRVRTIRRCPNGMDLERKDHVTCQGCVWDARIAIAGEIGEWGLWWTNEHDRRPEQKILVWPFRHDGPWATEAEAIAAQQRQYDDRLRAYTDGRKPNRDSILVRQWTPALAIEGRYTS